jgi:hypothetical protein
MRRDWTNDELAEHWTLRPKEKELLGNKTGATRLGSDDGAAGQLEIELANACVVRLKGAIDPELLRILPRAELVNCPGLIGRLDQRKSRLLTGQWS